MWIFGLKGASGFSASSTAEEVTQGIDGTGLTAVITGASCGIGAETARVLALCGVHVIMAVRNVESGKEVLRSIVKEIPNAKVNVMELDLSSMASVRKFASEYDSSGLPLNLLINNAGVMATPFMLSQDKLELQFATNHVGHFLLTNLLLDKMKHTARESHKEGRIVNVSSNAHQLPYSEGIRFDKINDEGRILKLKGKPTIYGVSTEVSSWKDLRFRFYNRVYAYGQSKLANILHAAELARRLKEEGVEITANSIHPGAIATNLLRHNGFIDGIVNWVGKYFIKNIPQGAATTCYVALHPQVKGVSGEYFSNSNIAQPSSLARDADLARKLWDFSLKLTSP